MKRRDFFRATSLTAVGSTLIPGSNGIFAAGKQPAKTAKNIIFMVSDGMSTGTLNMASLLLQRKEGRQSHWLKLYEQNLVNRALMDTASASSLVTDSAAASSAWGGGIRVKNGALNVSADGTEHTPILQKFKAAGKAVGCVTTVPITHATPAGFSITSKSRGDQSEIALLYLPLKFDVMLGGGQQYFDAAKRKDHKDVYTQFTQQGYQVVKTRQELIQAAGTQKPLLGAFADDGLPYTLDRNQDNKLQSETPALAELTKAAIAKLKQNKNGFVLQVEGGKVDWAAHANDAAALLYDQIAFDDAIKVAIDFAEEAKDTLVIITTDHGNSNPGLFYGDKANAGFDTMQQVKYTNEWVLSGINRNFSAAQVIERLEAAQNIAITKEEAASLLEHYTHLNEEGLYNPYKLPYKELAQIQSKYTGISWAGNNHSADYVELAAFGPGKELLPSFVKNTDLHNLMLNATGTVYR